MPLPSIPEYSTSIKTPALVHPQLLSGGHPIDKNNRLIKYSGGFCVVFPYETANKKYAVRCWHAEVSQAKQRTQKIAEALEEAALPYFVGFQYFEDGIMTPVGMQPIVVMDWVDAQPLKKFLAENISDSAAINKVAENFMKMVLDLHEHHFSHGDLQHGNIMVKPDRQLVLVDYDSMYVPSLDGMEDEIKGLAGYQHLSRWQNQLVSEKADYFSELVIYLSLRSLSKKPELWYDLNMEETDTLLFSAEDIQSGGSSAIFQRLRDDSELKPMVDTLCDFMAKSTIDELSPLEEAVISTARRISGKWQGGNGYVPTKNHIDDSEKIAGKWASGNGFSAVDAEENRRNKIRETISNKFKKTE